MKKKFIEHFLPQVDSTQLYAKKLYSELPANTWKIVVADIQTQGRGQFSRKWYSPPNNLYTTFVFQYPNEKLESLPCITQVAAVSVCQTLEKFKIKGTIKWKNDVLVNKRKICGILSEAETFGQQTLVYTGIGLNVNMTNDEAHEISQPFTSMKTELGNDVDKKEVYSVLRDHFMGNIDILVEKGFTQFLTYINTNSIAFGKHVRVEEDGYVSKGEFLGLDQRGFLVLKTDTGQLLVLSSGQMVIEDNKS